ncbi:MAG: TIGR03790 family protein [Akkermansia sp.]|nr:TIGR03790 family protein [Akkermansia sp.]
MMQKLFSLLLMLLCSCLYALEPDEVVVVYNADSELSTEAMRRYCAGRRIPFSHRLPLYGVTRGDISRADYDLKIKSALLIAGRDKSLIWPAGQQGRGKKIKAMVLMPDLPLRIKEEPVNGKKPQNGIPSNAAALDSELMLLGAEYPLASHGSNPYYNKPALPAADERRVVMAVCRIDGPDKECIKRMIDDPLKVERTGLQGWTVVDTGGKYKQGDLMMEKIAGICTQNLKPLFYEKSKSTIANDYPLMPNVVCYFGWYINPANGPFRKESATEFAFAPGAVAFHLHSYSATSIYDGKTWVSALLLRGAAVTAGNVAEPFLGPSLNCGLFYEHLANGLQVADAALLASPSVSWQCIIMGDPLYRPFPQNDTRSTETNPFVRWQKMVRYFKGDLAAMKKGMDAELKRKDAALFAEIYAGHCREQGKLKEAEKYYQLAAEKYGPVRDKLRAYLCLAYTQQEDLRPEDAGNTMQLVLERYAESIYAAAVKKAAADIPQKKPEPPPAQPKK